MPQFNLLYFPSQIFWLVVSFAALYIAMAYFLLPRVKGVLQKRDEELQKILTQADQLNAKAREIEESYQTYMNEAEQYAASIMNTARQSIEQKGREQEDAYAKQTQDSIAKLQKDMEQKRQSVLERVDDVCGAFIRALFRVVYKKKVALCSLEKAIRQGKKELKDV